MRSLPIVCSVLLVCGVFTNNGESAPTTPNVVIDGYTVSSTLNSPATLPLGTTVILVCRLSGIPHGLQTNYHWTCPNGLCQQTGYAGRKINNNIIAINVTSTSDGGTYTCNVTAEGREASQQFQLNVTGGQVVHSYGRLIFHERFITDKQQLQPPNNDGGDGRIECRVRSGRARFIYHGHRNVPTGTSGDVLEIRSGSTATVVIRDRVFSNFMNVEGNCAGIYHYLFLSSGDLPDVSITGTTSTDTSITVNIGTIPSGIGRVNIGYHRLDLGVPVVGEYVNNGWISLRTFSSLVPGAKYRITAWGFGGSDDRRRGQSPAVREVTTMEKELQRGQTHNITVVPVNSAGGGGGSQPITSYVHNPPVDSTKSPDTGTPTSTQGSGTPTASITMMLDVTVTPALTPVIETPSPEASCPPRVPSLPLNTMVLSTLTTTVPPGTTITIGCVDGYYTDREEILTCGSDGQWRGNITQCRETCTASNLTAISDGIAYTVPTEIRPGTVVGTDCGEGYQVAINAVCQDDRTWRVQEQCVQSRTSYNCPSINTAIIIAPILVGMVMLLVGTTLLVIGVILIVKRKRHTPTVQYDKESKVQIHDKVDDDVKSTEDTKDYDQELDVNEMDDTNLLQSSNTCSENRTSTGSAPN